MTYTIAVFKVKTPDDGQRNRSEPIEFYSKNKFEKLVHLVGFIIRIQLQLQLQKCHKHSVIENIPTIGI